jgi:hypothetical protein
MQVRRSRSHKKGEIKMITKIFFTGFLISIFSSLTVCQIKNMQARTGIKKPSVEIRLNYDKNYEKNSEIKLIEISLERKEKNHSQKVNEEQSIYFFNDLKPGKYLILLTFSKNGNPSTYGDEYWMLHGEKMDSKGRVRPVTEEIRDNEIRIRRSRLTILEIYIRFEKQEISPKGKGLEMVSSLFGKPYFYYKKEEKTYYYRIIFTLTHIKISKQKKQ